MKQKPSIRDESVPAPTHEEIALRAHHIWLEQGSPHGLDLRHWNDAEAQLLAARSASAETERDQQKERESNRLAPRKEDVPFSALRDEAPLATRVAEQTNRMGKPADRSPTSATL